jgi:hypothetical protein
MPIPRIYADETCPLEDYESFKLRVLQNSTDAEWRDWLQGGLGTPDCPDCAALRQPPVARGKRSKQPTQAPNPAAYCPTCTEARVRFGRAGHAFFGPGTPDLDFSGPEAALATLERDDLPSELLMWLTLLPGVVRSRRAEQVAGNLTRSLMSPS